MSIIGPGRSNVWWAAVLLICAAVATIMMISPWMTREEELLGLEATIKSPQLARKWYECGGYACDTEPSPQIPPVGIHMGELDKFRKMNCLGTDCHHAHSATGYGTPAERWGADGELTKGKTRPNVGDRYTMFGGPGAPWQGKDKGNKDDEIVQERELGMRDNRGGAAIDLNRGGPPKTEKKPLHYAFQGGLLGKGANNALNVDDKVVVRHTVVGNPRWDAQGEPLPEPDEEKQEDEVLTDEEMEKEKKKADLSKFLDSVLDSDSDANGPTPHGIPVGPPPAAAASPLEILETHTSLREIPEESLHSARRNVPTTQNILRDMMRRGNQQAHLLGKSLVSLRSEHLNLEKLAPVGTSVKVGTCKKADSCTMPLQARLADCREDGCCRIELHHDNQWGTVCDDNWNDADTKVACRSVGCSPEGARAIIGADTEEGRVSSGAAFGGDGYGSNEGDAPIWLKALECTGDEAWLGDCPLRRWPKSDKQAEKYPGRDDPDQWGRHNCKHKEDVGICCQGCKTDKAPEGLVPVAPDSSDESGLSNSRLADCRGEDGCCRIEIAHYGEWGTVCDDRWNTADTQVACRSAGCSTNGARAITGDIEDGKVSHAGAFGGGQGSIWLKNIACAGDEDWLGDCPLNRWGKEPKNPGRFWHNQWGRANCHHKEDVGVCCLGCCGAGTYPTTYTDTNVLTCIDCVPGKYSKTTEFDLVNTTAGSEACVDCTPGKYQPRSGSTACLECEQGKYCPTYGLTETLDCKAGHYCPKPGLSADICCNKGTYSSVLGSIACLQCDAGYYSKSKCSTACDQCEAGYYCPKPGLSAGICCEAGTYSLPGSTACLQCAAGYYAKDSCSTACDICPAGTYSLPGSAACLECDPGYYSGTVGSSSCDECVEDTYSDSAGATTCIGCAAGEFQPTRASTECTKYELKKVSLPVILECHPGFQSGYFGQSTVGCTEHIVDNTMQDYEDVFVQMLVALPLTLDEFNYEKQQDFKYAIAKAAQVDSSDVLIRNITVITDDNDDDEAMYATKPTILYRDGRRIPISDGRRIQKGVRYDDVDSLSAQLRKAQAQLDHLTNTRTESSGAAHRRNLLWSAVSSGEDEPSADDITIEFLVKAKTSTLARFVVDGLAEDRIDAQLRKVGLPSANILVEPQIMYLASTRIPDFHFGMDDPRNMHHLPGSENIGCSGGSSLTGSGCIMPAQVVRVCSVAVGLGRKGCKLVPDFYRMAEEKQKQRTAPTKKELSYLIVKLDLHADNKDDIEQNIGPLKKAVAKAIGLHMKTDVNHIELSGALGPQPGDWIEVTKVETLDCKEPFNCDDLGRRRRRLLSMDEADGMGRRLLSVSAGAGLPSLKSWENAIVDEAKKVEGNAPNHLQLEVQKGAKDATKGHSWKGLLKQAQRQEESVESRAHALMQDAEEDVEKSNAQQLADEVKRQIKRVEMSTEKHEQHMRQLAASVVKKEALEEGEHKLEEQRAELVAAEDAKRKRIQLLRNAVVREQKREITLLKEKKEMKEQESEATLVEMKIFVARESDLSPLRNGLIEAIESGNIDKLLEKEGIVQPSGFLPITVGLWRSVEGFSIRKECVSCVEVEDKCVLACHKECGAFPLPPCAPRSLVDDAFVGEASLQEFEPDDLFELSPGKDAPAGFPFSEAAIESKREYAVQDTIDSSTDSARHDRAKNSANSYSAFSEIEEAGLVPHDGKPPARRKWGDAKDQFKMRYTISYEHDGRHSEPNCGRLTCTMVDCRFTAIGDVYEGPMPIADLIGWEQSTDGTWKQRGFTVLPTRILVKAIACDDKHRMSSIVARSSILVVKPTPVQATAAPPEEQPARPSTEQLDFERLRSSYHPRRPREWKGLKKA